MIRPQSNKLLYYRIKICQAVNKWFGCKKLQGKKFSAGSPVGEEFLSSLVCAKYEGHVHEGLYSMGCRDGATSGKVGTPFRFNGLRTRHGPAFKNIHSSTIDFVILSIMFMGTGQGR